MTSSAHGALLYTAGLNTDLFDSPEDILCGLSCSDSGLSRDFWLLEHDVVSLVKYVANFARILLSPSAGCSKKQKSVIPLNLGQASTSAMVLSVHQLTGCHILGKLK